MDPNNKQIEEAEKFLEGILKEEYYDILTTEECFVDKSNDIGDNIILGYN